MTTFTAYFRTDGNYATLEIEADTPELALVQARKIADEDVPDLWYQAYDDGMPVNEIAIEDPDYNELAVWQDDDLRLRLAAQDLLDAARRVVDRWQRGDLAEAVRELAAAIAKAKGGAQ